MRCYSVRVQIERGCDGLSRLLALDLEYVVRVRKERMNGPGTYTSTSLSYGIIQLYSP